MRLGLHLSRGSPPRYESGARSANQSELSRHSLGPISTPKQRQRRRCNVLSAGLRGRLSRPAGSRPALFCSVLRLSLSLSVISLLRTSASDDALELVLFARFTQSGATMVIIISQFAVFASVACCLARWEQPERRLNPAHHKRTRGKDDNNVRHRHCTTEIPNLRAQL